METSIIAFATLIASCLTLFSGFGLGTLLMPVVALFFPVDVAIGITAIVHFFNNLFKLGLLGWQAEKHTVVQFGIPAMVAAIVGALVLGWLSHLPPLTEYSWLGRTFQVTPLKLIIGVVILVFVALESSSALAAVSLDGRFLAIGGCISGFFGGLSGHQGAFRSMFLLKAGLSKEQFIATGVVLAVLIDLARLLIYGWEVSMSPQEVDWFLVVVACAAAFAGAFIGSRLLKKATLRSIQAIVTGLLVSVALGLMAGML